MYGNTVQHFGLGFELGPYSGSITGGEFLDQSSDIYLLKKDTVHGVSVVRYLFN
jgi:hypothetical protein